MEIITKKSFEIKQKGAAVALCILCALLFTVKSCKNPDSIIKDIEQEQLQKPLTRSGELVWDYPVRPGMEQWKQFKSVGEMYQACQIPDGILENLDTESLVELCLNFPAPPLFPIFNTPQQAFMQYYSNFNGIRELFQRKDAGQYLLKKYSSMSFADFNPSWELYQQGRFVNNIKFIESIISQPQVIASLDANERKALLKITIDKIDEKLSKTDLFGGFSLEINLWAIGRLLYSENPSALEGLNQQNFQAAMNTGMFVDVDVDMLYRQAKNYASENN